MMADVFCLDLKTDENPGGVHSVPELYKALLDVRIWGFNNNDIAQSWNRRRFAQEGANALSKSTQTLVSMIANEERSFGIMQKLNTMLSRTKGHKADQSKEGSLRWYGRSIVRKLLQAGKTVEEVSDICWLTAFAGIGVVVAVVYMRILRLTAPRLLILLDSLPKSCNSFLQRKTRVTGPKSKTSQRLMTPILARFSASMCSKLNG